MRVDTKNNNSNAFVSYEIATMIHETMQSRQYCEYLQVPVFSMRL